MFSEGASPAGEGGDHLQATRGEDGGWAMVYTPHGQPFTVNLARLPAKELRVWWWDPRTGYAQESGAVKNEGPREFTPPRRGDSFDWVLVLDDPVKNYPAPGTTK